MKSLALFLLTLMFWTAFAQDNVGNVADVEHVIALRGTAQGGTVTLTFPSRVISVTTTAGLTAAQVATAFDTAFQNLLPAADPTNHAQVLAQWQARKAIGFNLHAQDTNVRVQGLSAGQVGLTSTDTGIITVPAVTNVTATKIDGTTVKVAWAIPTGATYDKIEVYSTGSSTMQTETGTATSTKDDLSFIKDVTGIPSSITYSVVAFSGDTPSAVVTVAYQP